MNDCGKYYFHYSESRPNERPDWITLHDEDFVASISTIRELVKQTTGTPAWAEDLYRMARAVYLADRRASRRHSPDKWTRTIHLCVEIEDPSLWQPVVIDRLTSLLRVLTSDVWVIDVQRGAAPVDAAPRLTKTSSVDVVALLSGGLDSAAYALDVASRGDQRMYLLSFHLDRHRGPQETVLEEVRRLAGSRVSHAGANPKVRRPRENSQRSTSSEDSSRSRGLLFATAGVLLAAASGVTTVQMPENGQVAINPSLTPARVAACSTKSVHPWVLWQLNRLIEAVGGDVEVVNPFLYFTKGEVCGIAYDALRRGNRSDAEGVLAATISCGNRSVNRPRNNNCGYCFPCLVRRSGLRAALGCDPTDYATAPQGLRKGPRTDLDDLRWWLEAPFTTGDLLAEAPIPPDVDVDRLMAMLCRGRKELRAMLDQVFGRGGVDPASAVAE